jgi:hypothetical protein
MASPGLAVFDAYVDSRTGSAADKSELKAKGEELYVAVYRELPALLDALGDADVIANPGDAELAGRQAAFKAWYAEMGSGGEALHQSINDRLEGVR